VHDDEERRGEARVQHLSRLAHAQEVQAFPRKKLIGASVAQGEQHQQCFKDQKYTRSPGVVGNKRVLVRRPQAQGAQIKHKL
jgi:hypothetical protein